MSPEELRLRNETYRLFVGLGRAPTAHEVAEQLGRSAAEVLDGWRRLHAGHALVLDDDGATIVMANPFSGVPTPFRVHAAGRAWFATCAWDAFGICAALHVDGRIETVCADCGDPLIVEVCSGRPDEETLLFHSLVPAAQWWDDIVFT